jgi:hypothetical protein
VTFKLITPPGMLFTTALLVIYGACAVAIGSIEDSWPLIIGGGVAAVATYGTAMVRPWSRYLVYLLTAGFVLKLGLSIYEAKQAGFFGFQFGSGAEVARSLIPSFVMALLGLACCLIVRRQFSGKRADPLEANSAQGQAPA